VPEGHTAAELSRSYQDVTRAPGGTDSWSLSSSQRPSRISWTKPAAYWEWCLQIFLSRNTNAWHGSASFETPCPHNSISVAVVVFASPPTFRNEIYSAQRVLSAKSQYRMRLCDNYYGKLYIQFNNFVSYEFLWIHRTCDYV